MKIFNFSGGLGNQILQYAFMRYISQTSNNELILLDNSYYELYPPQHSGFELERLFKNAKIETLKSTFKEENWNKMIRKLKELGRLHDIPNVMIYKLLMEHGEDLALVSDEAFSIQFERGRPFLGDVCKTSSATIYNMNPDLRENLSKYKNIYYLGCWIYPKFGFDIKTLLEKELEFPELEDKTNTKHMNDILNGKSVGIHIRRGDFIQLGWDSPAQSYKNCILDLKKEHTNLKFFIFSDDMDWCKENVKELGLYSSDNYSFIECNSKPENHYKDMQLMTYCDYLIGNHISTFAKAAITISKKNIILYQVKG